MPIRTVTGKTTIRTQREHGQSEFLLKSFHMAMPWCCWAGLTIFGTGLYLGLRLSGHAGTLWYAGPGALAVGLVVAIWEARLRSHRASWEARVIGPVTALAAGLMTCLFLLLGFSTALVMAWLFGGIIMCVCWDGWMAHGDHRDIAATFNAKAEAAGVAGARMVELGRRPASRLAPDGDELAPRRDRARTRDRRQEVVDVGLVMPSDPAMTVDEVGERLGHIEVATGSAPGSLSLVSSPDAAGYATGRQTPPDLLTRAPVPWPGPYAPGSDLSVPFRLALLQTGEPFLFHRMPISHLRVAGMTDSAKTMGLAWNMLAEGITRTDYAAFVVDTAKGEQFMGALRPALHQLILDEDQVHLFFARMHKARLDRCNFLGRNHITEWFPGCGLVFCENWLEEAGEVLKLLGTTVADRKDGKFMLEDYVGDVSTARSAGQAWTASFQKGMKEQSRSTVATSQMGRVCFALADKDDLKFGLSDLQRERGCRPTLFNNPNGRAMAYFDAGTVPDDVKVTPMRFFNWGPGSARIAAFAGEYPARDRPLDEVTGEAMQWVPAVSPSSTYSAPVYDNGARQGGNGRAPRQYSGPRMSAKKASQLEAELKTRQVIEGWRDDGRQRFTVDEMVKMSGWIGKARTWYYSTLPKIEGQGGLIEQIEGEAKLTYRILPKPADRGDPEQDESEAA